MTQRLESDFVEECKKRQDIWWSRWYHVMGKYTAVPGDFITIKKDKNILIECKECRGNRFVFERLTQKRSLMRFKEAFSHHKAYIIISFWRGRKDKSPVFVVGIDDMLKFIDDIGKKSANLQDFQDNFDQLFINDVLTYIL